MTQVDNGQMLPDVPQDGQVQVEVMTPTSDFKTLEQDKQGKETAEELERLKKRIAELEQYEPAQKTEQELVLEQKAQQLWQKEINLTLKEHNLAEFEPFFITAQNTEELTAQIEQLKSILKAVKVNNAFVPSDSNRSNDQYSLAESKKDTTTMIATKLSKIFK